jgi:hypothetical protein
MYTQSHTHTHTHTFRKRQRKGHRIDILREKREREK